MVEGPPFRRGGRGIRFRRDLGGRRLFQHQLLVFGHDQGRLGRGLAAGEEQEGEEEYKGSFHKNHLSRFSAPRVRRSSPKSLFEIVMKL